MKKCIFILILSLSLCSCGSVNFFEKNENQRSIQACGAYGTFGMFNPDAKGIKYDIIDRDEYGRILFKYYSNGRLTKEGSAYVICQKTEDDYTYFYEDICYLFEFYDSDLLEKFKEENDWNKELDFSKMSRRKIGLTFDLYFARNNSLEQRSVRESLITCGIKQENIHEFYFDDYDGYGSELYILELKLNETVENVDFYIVIVDDSYKPKLLKIDPSDIDRNVISEFKKANGWKYGFER